ncbi:hypothetical protein [Pelagovum pacificum]|nr:hypothetical protein [Pelagovum pacificum]
MSSRLLSSGFGQVVARLILVRQSSHEEAQNPPVFGEQAPRSR